MSTLDALGLLASFIFLVRLLPQPLHLSRHGVVEGVSALSALNAIVAALAWVIYGLMVGLPVVWGVSLLALVPGVWQTVLLRRVVDGRDVAWAGAFVAALAAAAVADRFAVALALAAVVTLAPQVRTALVARDLSGLAPATWWVAIADAAVWGLYGWMLRDGALIAYFAVLSAAATVVLGRIAWTQRRPLPGSDFA